MTGAVLLSLVSPVVAVIITIWGFRRSTRADKLRAFFEIQDRYLAGEVRAGRRTAHTLISGRSAEEVAKIDPAALAAAGYALAVMNSIAIACEAGYVDQALVAHSMGRSFATTFSAARPYIDHLESIRGFRPYTFGERLAPKLAGPRSLDLAPDSKVLPGSPGHGIPIEGGDEGSRC